MKNASVGGVLGLVLTLGLCGCGGTGLGPSPAPSKVGQEVYGAVDARGQASVIVVLREPAGSATSQSATPEQVAEVQRGVLSQFAPAEFQLTHRWTSVSGFAGQVTAAGLAKLEGHPDVLRVDVDRVVQASLAESVPLIRASDVHGLGITGAGVNVAVLDSGVDLGHPDLSDHIVGQECFCSGCCPNGSSRQSGAGSAQDDQGHGTNVAGIVAGGGRVAPEGVAPRAGVFAIKVLSRSGGGSSSDVVSALDFLGSNASVKVVNLSLGFGRFASTCDSADASNTALARAAANLKAKGVVIFAAAGNDGFTDSISSPACLSAATAVGAVWDDRVGGIATSVCTDSSTSADQVTCFSNSSPLVDLLAPGGLITAAGLGGGTSTEAGTSQATPHAAGTAALMLSAHPGLPPDQIVSVLRQTGVAVTDPKNGLTTPRIDALAAVNAVR